MSIINCDYSRLMGAVCGCLLLSSGVSRVRAFQYGNPQSVEAVDKLANAVISGGTSAIVDAAKTLYSPYDRFFYPLAELGVDSVVELFPYSFPEEFHEIASERMEERITLLKGLGIEFQEAPWDEKVRMISYLYCSAKAPTVLVNTLKPVVDLQRFGTYAPLPVFNAVWTTPTIKVEKYFQNSIRQIEGAERLIYVITSKGKLLVTNYYLSKHVNRGDGTAWRHTHRDLTKEPVVSAGEALVKDGKVTLLDNQSGHFRPWSNLSSQLAEITEYVFRKQGYSEVKGIFTDYTHKWVYMPDIKPIVTRPKGKNHPEAEVANLAALFEQKLQIKDEFEEKVEVWLKASTEAMGSHPQGEAWQKVSALEKEILAYDYPNIHEYQDIFTTQANRGEILWYLTTRQKVEDHLKLFIHDQANAKAHGERAIALLTQVAAQLQMIHMKWYGKPDPFFSSNLKRLNELRSQFEIMQGFARLEQGLSQIRFQGIPSSPLQPPSNKMVQEVYHKWSLDEQRDFSNERSWDSGVAAIRYKMDTFAKERYMPEKPKVVFYEAIQVTPQELEAWRERYK